MRVALVEALERHLEQGCPTDAPELAPLEDKDDAHSLVLDGAAMAGLVARLGRLDCSQLAEKMELSAHDMAHIEAGLEGLTRLAVALERTGIALGIRRLG